MNRPLCALLTLLTMALLNGGGAHSVHAHFPWLATDDEGRAISFFGESPEDREYHLPEAVAAAKVFVRSGDKKPVEANLPAVEEDGFIGRRSNDPVAKDAVLEMTCEYGLYHGMLLTYYAKHLPGKDAVTWEKHGQSKALQLDVTPQAADEGLRLLVTWKGELLKEAAVTLTDSSGEPQEAKTDERGTASFKKVATGPVGVIANFMDETKGEVDGKPYHSAGYYATLTFNYGDESIASAPAAKAAAGELPPLPEPLASFGGAVSDGWLYVYGGHIGTEHEHSKDNLSNHFRRLELDGGREWEELPMQTPLQGLPLAAHGGKLYRIGGLSARNASGEEENLHSVSEFACFDPQTKEWTELPPLPEPRSSHDATVMDGVLYVIGGWTLSGSSKGTWLDTAWSFDLARPEGSWQALPSPGFRRRALAVSHWQGKLVALGGMNDERKISRRVEALDLKSGLWGRLARLPRQGMGFGASALNLDGKLYVSGMQDSLYRLAEDGREWQAVAELQPARFFHRLVPGEKGTLLAVAGASEEGHLATIEELNPERRPALER